ncbi:MAG TPA: hypothetical protein VD978_15660 [Azospirillum sp.]|nr:hypothetical protein [Azospirillum sp.]
MATHDASSQGGPEHKAAKPLDRAQEEATEASRQGIGAAQNRIRTVFEQQSHRAADQVGSVAQALHSAAKQLEAENNGAVARYTGIAADRVEQFADTLRNSTIDDIVAQVEGYARRQPEIFLGAAFGIGFLFARFIKSSGERVRMADMTRQQSLASHQGEQSRQRGSSGGSYNFSTERQNIGGSYPAGARSVGGGGRDQPRSSPQSTPGSPSTGSSAGTRDAAQLMTGGSPEPIKSESATGEPNRAEPVSGAGKPQESKP